MPNSSSNSNRNNITNNNNNDFQYLVCYFIISVASKILLFPSYRSTDFDVHRHWKALTRTLSLQEWYFDNEHVPDTVHTLDYPPSFAFFEYVWSTNTMTDWLVKHEYLDDECLALESSSLSSTTTMLHGYQNPSTACITFMRSTVIISDIVLWFGAWMIANTAVVTAAAVAVTATTSDDKTQKWRRQMQNKKKWTIFGLIVANPGLLWLDSIHFQYNGFLLGILLLSLTCLVRGNHHHFHNSSTTTTATTSTNTTFLFHFWHIMAAVLFALLLTLKHLYMTLSLWYFAYLLRRYCFVHQSTTQTSKRIRTTTGGDNVVVDVVVFKPMRLLILGVVTVTTLVVPFLPFFISSSSSHRTAMEQASRMFERLFPFGRGLVHDYWAGNVWAIYMAMTKVFPVLKALEPSPKLAICLLLMALFPGAVVAWKAAAMASKADDDSIVSLSSSSSSSSSSSNSQFLNLQQQQQAKTRIVASELLWSSFTYTTLAAFMIAYHVHEKAILTTLVPMTIWLCCLDGGYNHQDDDDDASKTDNHLPSPPHATATAGCLLLLWRTMAFGLLGLFPLLFHPTELLLKIFSFTAYLVILSSSFQSSSPPPLQRRPHRCFQQLVWFLIVVALLVLECIPLRYFGRFEFVPLALTSLTTAMGLLISFLEVSWKMMQLVQ